jgi:xylulokinase
MSYLGLDIGTGGCKVVVFSAEGEELAFAQRGYDVLRPNDHWAELDSEAAIEKCFEAIREANRKIGEANRKAGDPVSALAISSQGEAFTPVAPDGNLLGKAMVSSDSRAAGVTRSWSRKFGEEKLYRITGHTPHPLFSLFKLLWIKENQPAIWSEARYFLCFEDLLQLKMGIEPHISWPMAGRTMLFDVIKHEWSGEILASIGLESSRLATPVPSGTVVGQIDSGIAKDLGFNNEVAIVSGGHDQTCAALGAGIVSPGMCMYATGTVECFCPMLEKPAFSELLRKNNLCCYDYTVGDSYTTVAYSLTGGNILQWARDELGYEERIKAEQTGVSAYQYLLEQMPDQPTGLLVLPYLSASGTPYFDPEAKGAIIGIRHSTTKGEIIKALLEGVALEMKLNLQLMEAAGMQVDLFVATGGGTRNDDWTQLKADVLNKKVIVREVREAGCYGAALLAQSALSGISLQHLIEPGKRDRFFEPDPEKSVIYDRKFKKFRKLYPALRQFWQNDH